MNREEKDLLLKDLCGRLPYGIICEDEYGNVLELNSIDKPNNVTFKCSENTFWTTDLDGCKPYMFPMSSMTEELREEHKDLWDNDGYRLDANDNVFTLQDFYCKYHLDFRGLIPMGLAIDATGKNIY